jgi:hypothetical protein
MNRSMTQLTTSTPSYRPASNSQKGAELSHLTRHPHPTIQPQHHSIQHYILNALCHELRELVRLAGAYCSSQSLPSTHLPNTASRSKSRGEEGSPLTRKFHNPLQTPAHLITHHSRHPRFKKTRRYRHNPDAITSKITS